MRIYLNPSRPRVWEINYQLFDETQLPTVKISADHWQEALEYYWAGIVDDDFTKLRELATDIEIELGASMSNQFAIWFRADGENWDRCVIRDITPTGDEMLTCENVVKQRLSKDERKRKRKGK